jgi:FeS assembly SUF system protein
MNEQIEQGIIAGLKTVYDPEIPVNIYDLGLIYKIDIDDVGVKILMTLTSAFCPSAEEIPAQVQVVVENVIQELNTTRTASVEVVFDPPWTPDRVSEEARLEMGMYDYDQNDNRLDFREEEF